MVKKIGLLVGIMCINVFISANYEQLSKAIEQNNLAQVQQIIASGVPHKDLVKALEDVKDRKAQFEIVNALRFAEVEAAKKTKQQHQQEFAQSMKKSNAERAVIEIERARREGYYNEPWFQEAIRDFSGLDEETISMMRARQKDPIYSQAMQLYRKAGGGKGLFKTGMSQ